jgi:hypothetical protein
MTFVWDCRSIFGYGLLNTKGDQFFSGSVFQLLSFLLGFQLKAGADSSAALRNDTKRTGKRRGCDRLVE